MVANIRGDGKATRAGPHPAALALREERSTERSEVRKEFGLYRSDLLTFL
jgi:hypothetical protein